MRGLFASNAVIIVLVVGVVASATVVNFVATDPVDQVKKDHLLLMNLLDQAAETTIKFGQKRGVEPSVISELEGQLDALRKQDGSYDVDSQREAQEKAASKYRRIIYRVYSELYPAHGNVSPEERLALIRSVDGLFTLEKLCTQSNNIDCLSSARLYSPTGPFPSSPEVKEYEKLLAVLEEEVYTAVP